ncbi:hypothetical protein FOA52_000034 [Chlamydomonas sp. UWO 241]|nr:hypothetical protein FOA52_000034 [Chlamydomonas sp. UWO 241]
MRYKLTTQDMGPAARCLGNMVPLPQTFQHPLPAASKAMANLKNVRAAIVKVLRDASLSDILKPDTLPDGSAWYGALFVNLAYQCASTFRATDYRGNCNGARIRLLPQSEWPNNVGMDKGLDTREAIALAGRLRSPTQQARLNYSGSYTNASATLSNDFYNYLLTEDWEGWVSKNESIGQWQYNNEGTSGDMVMPGDDLVILYNTTWRAVAQEFAADDAKSKATFASAWSKLMNADRFKGPTGNMCGGGISGVITEPSINSLVIS